MIIGSNAADKDNLGLFNLIFFFKNTIYLFYNRFDQS